MIVRFSEGVSITNYRHDDTHSLIVCFLQIYEINETYLHFKQKKCIRMNDSISNQLQEKPIEDLVNSMRAGTYHNFNACIIVIHPLGK